MLNSHPLSIRSGHCRETLTTGHFWSLKGFLLELRWKGYLDIRFCKCQKDSAAVYWDFWNVTSYVLESLKNPMIWIFLYSVGVGVGPGVGRKATHHWGFGQWTQSLGHSLSARGNHLWSRAHGASHRSRFISFVGSLNLESNVTTDTPHSTRWNSVTLVPRTPE